MQLALVYSGGTCVVASSVESDFARADLDEVGIACNGTTPRPVCLVANASCVWCLADACSGSFKAAKLALVALHTPKGHGLA